MNPSLLPDTSVDTFHERVIIGSILGAPGQHFPHNLAALIAVAPAPFTDPAIAAIATAIRTATKNGTIPDLIEIAHALNPSFLLHLNTLAADPSAALPLSLADHDALPLLKSAQGHHVTALLAEAWQASRDHPEAALVVAKNAITSLQSVTAGMADPASLRLLAEREFDLHLDPPPLESVYTLQNKTICTPGNLTSITSTIKTGKSSAIAAMMGAVMPHPPDADLLSFSSQNPQSLALVHFDSEQAEADHWHLVQRILRRISLTAPPPWFHSYSFVGVSARITQTAFFDALKQAADSHGGIHSAFLDGIADLVSDVNDAAECNDFIARLMDAARTYHCPIIGVIHFNPGSALTPTPKTRGHLGSQFERKSETNLQLDKTNDVTTIWSDKQRRAPIPKHSGPSFTWDDETEMHRSCDSPPTSQRKTGRTSQIQQIAAMNSHDFTAACHPSGEGLNEIAQRLESFLASLYINASNSTCKRVIPLLVANGKLLKDSNSLYFKGPNS